MENWSLKLKFFVTRKYNVNDKFQNLWSDSFLQRSVWKTWVCRLFLLASLLTLLLQLQPLMLLHLLQWKLHFRKSEEAR
ncbi:hypothetical protein Hamer_G019036 [Homarus americanus]|uniref:Uncharacterized protein n=1 Tax=Homarus americanus TaxID=6706 RepID=A0A8J5K025_HOMAM|nr:hypothetical protein Hamer_G019036 [Homarus americanus]